MKMFRRHQLYSILYFALILNPTINAQEAASDTKSVDDAVELTATGEIMPATSSSVSCDCTAEIQAATAPLLEKHQGKTTELDTKLKNTIEELDEIIEERNRLLEDIKRLRQSLHAARTEMESLRSSLESEKTAKDSLQQQFISIQAQAASLKRELDEARAEIKRLNEISFIVNFRKEAVALWEKILHFAKKAIAKKE